VFCGRKNIQYYLLRWYDQWSFVKRLKTEVATLKSACFTVIFLFLSFFDPDFFWSSKLFEDTCVLLENIKNFWENLQDLLTLLGL